MQPRSLRIGLLFCMLGVPRMAAATETAETEQEREKVQEGAPPAEEHHHGPHQVFVMALAPTALTSIEGNVSSWYGGGTAMFEVPLFHHQMEVELSVGLGHGLTGLTVPVDLLAKHAFRLGEHWRPYVGVGPSLTFEHDPYGADTGEINATWGAAGNVGAYYWFTRNCAVFAYGEYTAVFAEAFRNEIEMAVGVAFAITTAPEPELEEPHEGGSEHAALR